MSITSDQICELTKAVKELTEVMRAFPPFPTYIVNPAPPVYNPLGAAVGPLTPNYTITLGGPTNLQGPLNGSSK